MVVRMGFVVALWAVATLGPDMSAQAQTEDMRPRVSVVAPRLESLRETVRVSGSVVAVTPVTVRARQEGLIVEALFVDEGAWVEQGALLARLDGSDLELSRSAASAEAERADAAVRAAEAAVTSARSVLALARQQSRRVDALAERGAASGESVDARQAELRQAEASVARAEGELRAARAALQAEQARLQALDLRLEQTEIRAPVAGRVLSRPAELGEVAGPLFEMAGAGTLALDGRVLETAFARLSPGMEAKITLPDGSVETGKVLRLAGRVDPQTRQGGVLVALADDTTARVGNFAQGRLALREISGLTLPESAVRDGQVWRVEAGVIRRVRVVPLLSVAGRVAIGGLSPRAQVVRQFDAFVSEGMEVVPVGPDAATAGQPIVLSQGEAGQ